MELVGEVWAFLTAPEQWSGSASIPSYLVAHLEFTGWTVLISLAIALPVGLLVGHTGQFGQVAINIANIGRAIPSFGIVILSFTVAGFSTIAVIIALAAFAIPPILTNTYTGVRGVDEEIRDAASGMGLTGWQTLWRVEVPVALPLIMAGIRTSVVQTIATATLASFLAYPSFGQYIFDGVAQQDTAKAVAGGALVALLALFAEVVLARLQAFLVSRGLQERNAEAVAQAKAG